MNRKVILLGSLMFLCLFFKTPVFAESSSIGYLYYPVSYPNESVMWPEIDYNLRFSDELFSPVVGFTIVPWYSIQAFSARAGLRLPIGMIHSEILVLGGAGFAIGARYKDEISPKTSLEFTYRFSIDLQGFGLIVGSGISYHYILGSINQLYYGVPVEFGFSY